MKASQLIDAVVNGKDVVDLLKEEDIKPVTMKDFKQAMQAHNAHKESASFNDNYNVSKGLGAQAARYLCSMIASENGSGKDKISMKDAIEWTSSVISSELKPQYKQVYDELRHMNLGHKDVYLKQDAFANIKVPVKVVI